MDSKADYLSYMRHVSDEDYLLPPFKMYEYTGMLLVELVCCGIRAALPN